MLFWRRLSGHHGVAATDRPPHPAAYAGLLQLHPATRWRFRLVVGLIFLVVLGGLALLLFTVILSNSEGNPGLNPQGLADSHGLASSTVASVPPSGAGVSVS